MNEWVWSTGVTTKTGKLKYFEKDLSQCHCVHAKPHMVRPGWLASVWTTLFQLRTWYDSETQAFRLSSRRQLALGHQALDTAAPSAHQPVPWTQLVQLVGSLVVLEQRHRVTFLQRRWELRDTALLLRIQVVWDVMLCRWVCSSWHFIVSWCLHL